MRRKNIDRIDAWAFSGAILSAPMIFIMDQASGRTIRVNECIVSIGSFCPIESIGATLGLTLIMIGVFALIRWIIRAIF